MPSHPEHVGASETLQSSNRVFERSVCFFFTIFCTLLLAASTNAQVPIRYYDFENNTPRTTFENLVEQAVNTGSAPVARAGNTTTINAVAGAGTFNGGSAAGQAATGSNWDSATADPGPATTKIGRGNVRTP